VEVVGFWGLTECFEGVMVVLCPVSLLKFLELLLDIIGLILNDLDTFVVDMDAIVSLLDVCLKGFEEFLNLILEFLTLFRLSEIFVKSFKLLSLFSLAQFIESFANVVNWLAVLNMIPGELNIVPFLLDGSSTLLVDLNLEQFSVVLPVLWDIRDLDVLLERSVKFLELFLQHVPLLRLSEIVDGMSELLSLFGLESFLPGDVIFLSPMGMLQFLVHVSDVLGLIFDDLDTFVVDVDAIWSLLDVLLESLTEFLPLFHELLTLWGFEELLVKLLNCLNLISVSPLLKASLNTLDWLRVFDLLGSMFDIVEFFLNFIGAGFSNLDLEQVLVMLPLLWDISDLDVLLDGLTKFLHLLLEVFSLWRKFEVFG